VRKRRWSNLEGVWVVILLVAGVLALRGQVAVLDAIGKPLHVAVEIPTKNHQLWPGVLTLGVNEVRFESDQHASDELLFSIPVRDMEEVEVAGFRERFLSLKIRQNADFVKAYSFLFSDSRSPGENSLTVNFSLGAKEDLRVGMATADELKSHLVHAPSSTKDASVKADQSPKAVLPSSSMIGRTPGVLDSSPGPSAPSADPRATELFRQEARYLEKLRGFSALMVTNLSGTGGELVFFDDGFGYRSQRQNPRISPAKSQFLEGGYLKFRLKNDWVQNVVYKPVKGNPNCVVVVVQIKKDSPFFANSRGLLTDTGNDNEIVFLVTASSQYQIASYFRTKLKESF